ncbi:MAG: excinuclease ABC subunit UvrB [Flavobacteriaceae bacterium]|nr:excinuclease ABC subunit UvrB [Flavobacteriaceae bacterium]
MKFKLVSSFSPTGDQPQAIQKIVDRITNNEKNTTLKGVTGSGKTFTVANVLEQLQRPTLVLTHNKALGAQLYSEFKQFFPENAVEYFISYYDYYQPEAYLPTTGLYIEKDLSINKVIEKYRLSATSKLLSGRRDIIVVASVSCIFGLGNPDDFNQSVVSVSVSDQINKTILLQKLVQSMHTRSNIDFLPGTFRVLGDVIDIYPAYSDWAYKIHFFGDDIEEIESFHPETGEILETNPSIRIYPANMFVTTPERIDDVITEIENDLKKETQQFILNQQQDIALRLEERTKFDIEMLKELGYCSGIENYSRYFDRRKSGSRPFCLLDYFPHDYLMVIDESHATIPQVHAMFGGDRSRKENLVAYGFRLKAAMDNRPLKFEEFEALQQQVLYVSATPADFEIEKSGGHQVLQVLRPTGLLDPKIEVRPTTNQIDDLVEEIQLRVEANQRVLITTLTKRMAEELSKFLVRIQIKATYLHSEVDTLDRVDILQNLRTGDIDVIVGVNLLREGLDLPEVSLVIILDADKQGFLRSQRALIQTVGRAARHIDGKALFYADDMSDAMKATIDETNFRREAQKSYNKKHHITPQAIKKSLEHVISRKNQIDIDSQKKVDEIEQLKNENLSPSQIEKKIKQHTRLMNKASKELDFPEAARQRDYVEQLKNKLNKI